MQELVGRLTALDPEASETLKVVAYFDVLVGGGVGLQALLRGAALLSGTVAGAVVAGRSHRAGPDGARREAPADGGTDPHEGWPSRPVDGGHVWIEREGRPHANDDMVVERLALAVELVRARHDGETVGALGIVLDASRDVAERRTALARLRLDPAREYRVAAVPASRGGAAARPAGRPGAVGASGAPGAPSTVVATPYGLVRAVVLGRAGSEAEVSGPAGIGVARAGDQLPESFRTALLALRLRPRADSVRGDKGLGNTGLGNTRHGNTEHGNNTGPGNAAHYDAGHDGAVLDAADLGVVLAAVSALEPVAAQQPDVAALARLDARTRAVLDELAAAESVRAAATVLGMHHSTLQVRHDHLTTELGYDPRSLPGRARFQLARLLLRLVEHD
ncbi:hypothetical protein [Promicromonospora sukumoe]|uniref:hypothetical protein n=1 Tax=Promicromonospora sukumoe TaxID=88382 RepID=UPI003649DBF4